LFRFWFSLKEGKKLPFIANKMAKIIATLLNKIVEKATQVRIDIGFNKYLRLTH